MLLYNVPRKSNIRFQGEILFFDHIDGMYSYCKDKNGNIVHLSASCDVEVINTNKEKKK